MIRCSEHWQDILSPDYPWFWKRKKRDKRRIIFKKKHLRRLYQVQHHWCTTKEGNLAAESKLRDKKDIKETLTLTTSNEETYQYHQLAIACFVCKGWHPPEHTSDCCYLAKIWTEISTLYLLYPESLLADRLIGW